jgi:hypothetical protein
MEPATFRLVAQCLNQLCHQQRAPDVNGNVFNCIETCGTEGNLGAALHSANFRSSWEGEWSRPRSGRFTCQASSGTHCRKFGGPQGVCGWVLAKRKFFPSSSWSLQPLTSRYLDNPTPDTNLSYCTLKSAGSIPYIFVQWFFYFLERGLISAIKGALKSNEWINHKFLRKNIGMIS